MAAAVEKAYVAIREGIIGRAFPPNTHLTAQMLASATGLSRTPVREAMRRLHAEGLIELIPHRGAFVRGLDREDIHKIYDLVIMLETFAAEACALNATSEQLDELAALSDDMERDLVVLNETGSTEAAEAMIEANGHFHRLIVAAAHNSWLEAAFTVISEAPQVLNTFRGYDADEMRRSQVQHVELVMAFREHNVEWARSIMRSHILAARRILLRNQARAG
jgi:DNA-binding GntR family transcriptional regulator